MLIAEGAARGAPSRRASRTRARRSLRRAMLAGAFLVGLSTLQAEFDFGVPQFRLLFQPVLMMTPPRSRSSRRGSGSAAAARSALFGFFLVIRGLLTGLVGAVLGPDDPALPALRRRGALVEVVALRSRSAGPSCSAPSPASAIGTFGLAAEWGWSHVWMTMSWPSSLLPEAVIFGLLAAVAGGVLGGAIGRALAPPVEARALPALGRGARRRRAGRCARVPAADLGPHKVTAQVKLTDAAGPPKRTVNAGSSSPRRRRRQRGVVQVDRLAGRRFGRRRLRGSPPASTARRSRSRSTATGRRRCACTRAASSPARRCSCPRIPRSRPRRRPRSPR